MDVLVSNPDSPPIYTAAFLLGIFLHVGLFRIGEWDLFVPQLLLISTTLYSALIYFYVFYSPLGPDLWVPVVTASKLFSVLIGGIYTSIATYRLLFHPLRRFPGPFLSGLTSLYPVWLLVRKLHMYEEVQQLHEKYGDIVRLGKIGLCHPSCFRR